ncbi:glycoside hydrolase family 18 protein [Thelonectria olida]|uniref:chitinase n=1 Tax=Thelonectria olida TaxID=1576542 RepID=A0A9P8WGU1_9HYPO|nr:glycoside hydrolase family 18 protein [Thelonectria olida]
MLRPLFATALLLAQAAFAAPGLDPKKHEVRDEAPLALTTITTTIATTVIRQLASSQTSTSTSTALAVPPAVSLVFPDDPSVELNETSDLDTRATGKRNVLYFTNWGIYGANFQPQDIPADVVTHLLYSFLNIAEDGSVVSADSWSDTDKHYATDSWNDAGNNIYGCAKQLYILKKKHRKFKTMLSIGGWTYSPKFAPVAADATKRKRFASTAVKLLADWGFDGIDVDWEYPTNPTEADNYVLLLKDVRAALDAYTTANRLNYRFTITVASPAGSANYNAMNLKGMDAYVDAWHLMAYDYAGSWDAVTGHQASLYHSKTNMKSTPFRTDGAFKDYLAKGIAASKIVMGIPLYGRSFANTLGAGKPYSGVGGGTIEPGIYTYKNLPRPGATVYMNPEAKATWSYDFKNKEMVTWDSPASAKIKANYILDKNMGGAMYWEASGDKTGPNSIVKTVAGTIGPLDQTLNMLSYPKSVYDNIRLGMPSS